MQVSLHKGCGTLTLAFQIRIDFTRDLQQKHQWPLKYIIVWKEFEKYHQMKNERISLKNTLF